MTKIEKPSSLSTQPLGLSTLKKKRSWTSTHDGRLPFHLHEQMTANESVANQKPHMHNMHHHQPRSQNHGCKPPPPSKTKHAIPSTNDMQSMLSHYHALAIHHHTSTKRRRLETHARQAQTSARLAHLTRIQKVARDTLTLCNEVLQKESQVKRDEEQECAAVEQEMKRAERERAKAEEYYFQFGISGRNSLTKVSNNRTRSALGERKSSSSENIENRGGKNLASIGGIPSKFLDLSHFPKLQKLVSRSRNHNDSSMFSSEELDGEEDVVCCKKKQPIIDCTEEGVAASAMSPSRRYGNINVDDGIRGYSVHDTAMKSASSFLPLGIPQEVITASPSKHHHNQQKQNTTRIYISHSSLPHVNGTYIQEGLYNGAPIFVRVGPPRKFMGKFDCSVVLRREKKVEQVAVGKKKSGASAKEEYNWKIGLVPAHRITHPRLICYFVANEKATSPSSSGEFVPTKRVSNMDNMMDEDCGMDGYIEPPTDCWRVFQEAATKGGSNAAGRASSLKVSHEE